MTPIRMHRMSRALGQILLARIDHERQIRARTSIEAPGAPINGLAGCESIWQLRDKYIERSIVYKQESS